VIYLFRLKSYHQYEFAKYICLRQLYPLSDRSEEFSMKLSEFCHMVVGKPYAFKASNLVAKKNVSIVFNVFIQVIFYFRLKLKITLI
jgi:hypothetical protein